jgi:phage tail sheath protein FI
VPDEDAAFEYVSFDREGDVIRLRLPPDAEQYRQELIEELVEEFSYEPRTSAVEKRMNEYVRNWMAQRQGGHPETGTA